MGVPLFGVSVSPSPGWHLPHLQLLPTPVPRNDTIPRFLVVAWRTTYTLKTFPGRQFPYTNTYRVDGGTARHLPR